MRAFFLEGNEASGYNCCSIANIIRRASSDTLYLCDCYNTRFCNWFNGCLVATCPTKDLELDRKSLCRCNSRNTFYCAIIFIYFGLNSLNLISLDNTTAGIVTVAINAGAYFSEIIRAGIQSIDKGQTEAARSIGFTSGQTMRFIILPQAFRRMLPTITNQSIISLKDTSLLSVIGIADLTQQGQIQASATFEAFKIWLAVGVIYFIVIYLLTMLASFVERRFQLR